MRKKDVKKLKTRVSALELKMEDLKTSISEIVGIVKENSEHLSAVLIAMPHAAPPPPPVIAPVHVDPDEPRGLDCLFDKPVIFRHKCMACGHVRVNKLPAPQLCNKCKKPMNTAPVSPRGKRNKKHTTRTPAHTHSPARATGATV